MTEPDEYEVFAIRYATREARLPDHFIGGDPHDSPMPMDYFVWLVRNPQRTFVVDTGFNAAMAAKRNRQLLRSPKGPARLQEPGPLPRRYARTGARRVDPPHRRPHGGTAVRARDDPARMGGPRVGREPLLQTHAVQPVLHVGVSPRRPDKRLPHLARAGRLARPHHSRARPAGDASLPGADGAARRHRRSAGCGPARMMRTSLRISVCFRYRTE